MTRSNAVWFGIGAVAGGVATALFFLIKEGFIYVGEGAPYREDLPEEDGYSDSEAPIPFKDAPKPEAERVAYDRVISTLGYKADEVEADDAVSVISEEDYFEAGRDGSFDMTALTLYGDGVVADAVTDKVLQPEDLASALGSHGNAQELRRSFDSGKDILYFQNGRLFSMYEISFDSRTYEEVTGEVNYG